MRDPEACIASRKKMVRAYFVTDSGIYRVTATAEVMAALIGVKWDTVKKRRLRGSTWQQSFTATAGIAGILQGHTIRMINTCKGRRNG